MLYYFGQEEHGGQSSARRTNYGAPPRKVVTFNQPPELHRTKYPKWDTVWFLYAGIAQLKEILEKWLSLMIQNNSQ